MRIGLQGAIMAGVLAAAMPAHAQGTGAEANRDLRATIRKWVEVMKATQTVQQEWKQDQQVLENARDALGQEIKQLEAEIAAARERIALAEDGSETRMGTADKLARKRMYEDGREALRVGLDEVEKAVSAVIPLLPKELAETPKVEAAILEHRHFAESAGKGEEVSLNKRLNAMLTILAEAEKFNQTVQTFTGRSMAVDGERLLLDVVYFGLSFGYAVDEKGALAFQLIPTALGWTDRRLEQGELSKAVRELVDVANRNGEARLVTVPVKLDE